MKKQYNNPTMIIFKIDATVLQPASSFGKNSTETVSNNDDVLSRGFWGFDDDDEEE